MSRLAFQSDWFKNFPYNVRIVTIFYEKLLAKYTGHPSIIFEYKWHFKI